MGYESRRQIVKQSEKGKNVTGGRVTNGFSRIPTLGILMLQMVTNEKQLPRDNFTAFKLSKKIVK